MFNPAPPFAILGSKLIVKERTQPNHHIRSRPEQINVRQRFSKRLLNKVIGLLDAPADCDHNGTQNGYGREAGDLRASRPP